MLKNVRKIIYQFHYIHPVILGLCVSFFIVSIAYYKFNTVSTVKSSSEKIKKFKSINSVDTDFILKTNMFNILTEKKKNPIPVKTVEEQKEPEEQIKITNEKFNGSLIGIITGKQNLALINFKNKFILLRLNKTIENITLKKISTNEIVIAYQGKNYKLVLDENLVKSGKRKSPSVNSVAGSTEKIVLKKGEAIAQLRDVNRFMRDVVVFPYYYKQKFKGYKISRIARNSILRRAGLLPGDILVRVNGESVKNPQQLMTIFSKVNEVTAINLDIIRKGDKKSIFIELEE